MPDPLTSRIRTYPGAMRSASRIGWNCLSEDCGGPESFIHHRNDRFSFDALEDLDTMAEVFQQVAAGRFLTIATPAYTAILQRRTMMPLHSRMADDQG